MFTKSEVIQIFPTCLWVHRLAEPETLNQALSSTISSLQSADPAAAGQFQSWQSPADLHRRAGFEALEPRFLAAAGNVMRYLKADCDSLYITDCWANVNRTGQSLVSHTHPNNYLSGVYYVKAPAHCGRIVFSDPRPQASAITPRLHENTLANSNQMNIDPEAGKLILFNAWLPHFVEANRSGEDRISIAFNIMVKGKIGSEMASAEV